MAWTRRSAVALVVLGALGVPPAFATTVTPSRTATRTCTPGFNPPPGCAYEGPNMALDGLAGAPFCVAALCGCHAGSPCAAAVNIDCLIRAVGHALGGCPAAPG